VPCQTSKPLARRDVNIQRAKVQREQDRHGQLIEMQGRCELHLRRGGQRHAREVHRHRQTVCGAEVQALVDREAVDIERLADARTVAPRSAASTLRLKSRPKTASVSAPVSRWIIKPEPEAKPDTG
jgi:hypothetical protein